VLIGDLLVLLVDVGAREDGLGAAVQVAAGAVVEPVADLDVGAVGQGSG
jgi:hypothetical protein